MRFLTLILLLAAHPASTLPQLSEEPAWQKIAQDKWVRVSVERVLYKKPQGDGFFVHIRVDNESGRRLGVDLRDPFNVIYPNQWTIQPRPERRSIDEGRIQRRPDVDRNALLRDFRDGHLTGFSDYLDYFREFDGKSSEPTNSDSGRYLLISMDGRLVFSDGKAIDVISLEWGSQTTDAQTDVVVPLPIKWNSVQAGMLVIKNARQ